MKKQEEKQEENKKISLSNCCGAEIIVMKVNGNYEYVCSNCGHPCDSI